MWRSRSAGLGELGGRAGMGVRDGVRVRVRARVRVGVRVRVGIGGRGCGERGGCGETGDGVLIGSGHGGLELLKEEREALVTVVGGAARGCLDSSKAVEDRAEPAESRVRAEAREVGPDEGEVGEMAEGGARLVVGRLRGITKGVEPGARGGGVGEVGGHVRDRDGAIGREGGRGLKGGGGTALSVVGPEV